MAIDLVTIQKMTPEARSQLWMNAQNRLAAGGAEVIELIKKSGLPLRSGGMTLSDPVYLRMEEIIWSAEARPLLIEATERGLPALAGVEPLIVADLGTRYTPHDQGTVSAGSLVAEVIKFLGYKEIKKGDMPEGSVAKTAAVWSR
ncbi:hypothetical protein L3V16_21210 [Brucella ciceri]|uniref:hypothetical protein n=1 Tax=Brucella ciceri TaxID=391287 RepID=UPI001F13C9A7|nr:hypothetical protein [Brucella ciceri]MCH6206346.1 hypothetical protein [Brucella ciceri]